MDLFHFCRCPGLSVSGTALAQASGVQVNWDGQSAFQCQLWLTDRILEGTSIPPINADVFLLDSVYFAR